MNKMKNKRIFMQKYCIFSVSVVYLGTIDDKIIKKAQG